VLRTYDILEKEELHRAIATLRFRAVDSIASIDAPSHGTLRNCLKIGKVAAECPVHGVLD